MMNNLDNLSKEFGKRIKIERIKKEVSQEKLAELSGLHRTTLGTIENGKTSPTLDSVAKIAKALNVKMSELLEGLD